MSVRELLKLGGFNDPGATDRNWNCVNGKRRQGDDFSTRMSKRARHGSCLGVALAKEDRVLARCQGSLSWHIGTVREVVQKPDQPVGFDVLFDDGTSDACVKAHSIKPAPTDTSRSSTPVKDTQTLAKTIDLKGDRSDSPSRLYGKKRWIDMELKASQDADCKRNKENAQDSNTENNTRSSADDSAADSAAALAMVTIFAQPNDRKLNISYICTS